MSDDNKTRDVLIKLVGAGIEKSRIASRQIAGGAWNDAYNYLLDAESSLSLAREYIDPTRFFAADYPEETGDE